MSDPRTRRAKILNYIIITLIALMAATILLIVVAGFGDIRTRAFYGAMTSAFLLLLIISQFLNQKGKYMASAVILVACAYIGPWASVVFSSLAHNGDFIPLIFTALTVFLCAILLPLRAMVLLTVLQILGIAILLLATSDLNGINWQSLVAFILFSSMLASMYSYIHKKDYAELEAMTRKLMDNEAKLKEMSVRDELTGLFNWRFMIESLDREIQRSARKRRPIGVIMLDIDDFKNVNDRFGHLAGDAVLAQLSKYLKMKIRAGDIACRYGGDEFVMILPETELLTAAERAMILSEEIGIMEYQTQDAVHLSITVSVGVAAYPEHGATGKELLAAADAALYFAKGKGKNQTAVAE
jgi:diguanylate cyclase (GGDEF)-like protein